MGWDAFATKNDNEIYVDWHRPLSQGGPQIVDPELRGAFGVEAEKVIDVAGAVDFLLHLGGLDCYDCAEMIKTATGVSPWSEDDWSSDKVKELASSASWEFDVADEDLWAYCSARSFLDTCAKYGLGIHLSW